MKPAFQCIAFTLSKIGANLPEFLIPVWPTNESGGADWTFSRNYSGKVSADRVRRQLKLGDSKWAPVVTTSLRMTMTIAYRIVTQVPSAIRQQQLCKIPLLCHPFRFPPSFLWHLHNDGNIFYGRGRQRPCLKTGTNHHCLCVFDEKSVALKFSLIPRHGLDLKGNKRKKREIFQIDAFLEVTAKRIVLFRSHSRVCFLIGFPLWIPICDFNPSRHPLQGEFSLVLMLSNRCQSGAIERRNRLNWVMSSYPCTNFPTSRRLNWPFQLAHPFILECEHLPLAENSRQPVKLSASIPL